MVMQLLLEQEEMMMKMAEAHPHLVTVLAVVKQVTMTVELVVLAVEVDLESKS